MLVLALCLVLQIFIMQMILNQCANWQFAGKWKHIWRVSWRVHLFLTKSNSLLPSSVILSTCFISLVWFYFRTLFFHCKKYPTINIVTWCGITFKHLAQNDSQLDALTLHLMSRYGWMVVQWLTSNNGFTLQNKYKVEKHETSRELEPRPPSEHSHHVIHVQNKICMSPFYTMSRSTTQQSSIFSIEQYTLELFSEHISVSDIMYGGSGDKTVPGGWIGLAVVYAIFGECLNIMTGHR